MLERLSRFFLLSPRNFLALALLCLVSLPAVTARLYSSDEVQYFSYLRSLYFDRDVSFENEYRYFYERNIAPSAGFHETFLERETAVGRRVNYGTLGSALLWSPFYAAADLWTRATGSHAANGFTPPYVRAVAYGSAFYGFLAILLSIRAAAVILGRSSNPRHRRNTATEETQKKHGHRRNTEETLPEAGHRRNTEETLPQAGHRRSTEETLPQAGHRGNTEETLERAGHSGNTRHRRNTEEALEHTEPTRPETRQRREQIKTRPGQSGPLSFFGVSSVASDSVASASVAAGAAVWLGTPLLFYMYVAPPFAHACSAFAAALFVNVWLHVRETWSARGTFALGLSVALMAMVREQDVFLALGPLIDFARAGQSGVAGTSNPNHARMLMRAALAGIAGTALGYVPQLLAYNALNGYPGPAEHVARKMYWYAPHGLQVLASPHHGLFFWTPLALLALAGLFAVRERIVAACLAAMVASQVYVAGSVESWTVAGAFGQRRFVCLTIVFVIGLAALLHATRERSRVMALVVTAVLVWWNIALMAQFATRLMDRQRLEPTRNAYHAFVTLPIAAPSLVYRYLTDRASFYESQPRDR